MLTQSSYVMLLSTPLSYDMLLLTVYLSLNNTAFLYNQGSVCRRRAGRDARTHSGITDTCTEYYLQLNTPNKPNRNTCIHIRTYTGVCTCTEALAYIHIHTRVHVRTQNTHTHTHTHLNKARKGGGCWLIYDEKLQLLVLDRRRRTRSTVAAASESICVRHLIQFRQTLNKSRNLVRFVIQF